VLAALAVQLKNRERKNRRLRSSGSARNLHQEPEKKKPQITQIKKIERELLEHRRVA
jgi:hypothetical protein